MQITQASALLSQLADQHRLVVSPWRTLLFVRRATYTYPPGERRWDRLPLETSDVAPLLSKMRSNGQLERIRDGNDLDRVRVAYARELPIDEREALMELHPYASLSHLSALVHHGLALETPKHLTITAPRNVSSEIAPIGTRGMDWEDLPYPRPRIPKQIMGTPISWNTVRPDRYFGYSEYEPLGFPIRYTSLERTLLDGLQQPEMSGGISIVLRAWALAVNRIQLPVLVSMTERFGIGLLRQRVGFVLDQLGLSTPAVEHWRASAKRGGSSKLVGSAPFASTYDERWNLSINAPIDELRTMSW